MCKNVYHLECFLFIDFTPDTLCVRTRCFHVGIIHLDACRPGARARLVFELQLDRYQASRVPNGNTLGCSGRGAKQTHKNRLPRAPGETADGGQFNHGTKTRDVAGRPTHIFLMARSPLRCLISLGAHFFRYSAPCAFPSLFCIGNGDYAMSVMSEVVFLPAIIIIITTTTFIFLMSLELTSVPL